MELTVFVATIYRPGEHELVSTSVFTTVGKACDWVEQWAHHKPVGAPHWDAYGEYWDDARILANVTEQAVL